MKDCCYVPIRQTTVYILHTLLWLQALRPRVSLAVAGRRCPSLPVAAFSFLLPPSSRSDACFSVSASWRYRCRKHDFLFALICLYFVYLPNLLPQRACLGPWNLPFCYFGLLKGIDLRILGWFMFLRQICRCRHKILSFRKRGFRQILCGAYINTKLAMIKHKTSYLESR